MTRINIPFDFRHQKIEDLLSDKQIIAVVMGSHGFSLWDSEGYEPQLEFLSHSKEGFKSRKPLDKQLGKILLMMQTPRKRERDKLFGILKQYAFKSEVDYRTDKKEEDYRVFNGRGTSCRQSLYPSVQKNAPVCKDAKLLGSSVVVIIEPDMYYEKKDLLKRIAITPELVSSFNDLLNKLPLGKSKFVELFYHEKHWSE